MCSRRGRRKTLRNKNKSCRMDLKRRHAKQQCMDTRTYAFQLFKLEKIIPQREEQEELLNRHRRGEPHKPLPRSGHRIVNDGANLYAIGGYNPHIPDDPLLTHDVRWQGSAPLFYEVWKFNIARKVWTLLKFSGPMPTQLASHSALILPDCENILVFGGTGHPFGMNASNRLHVFNTRLLQWKEIVPKCKEEEPEQLYGQAVTHHNHNFYTIGGTSGHDYSSDVHMFDLKEGKWHKLNIPSDSTLERNRYRHEIAYHDNEIILFGGGTANSVNELRSFDVFQLETRKWCSKTSKPDPVFGFPRSRRCHSIERKDNFIFVYGGYDGLEIFTDVWRFDLNTYTWSRILENIPRKVYFHSSTMTEEGRMFVFGGVCSVGDMESNVRTNDLYSMWICVPKLQRMAWEAILFYAKGKLNKIPSKLLREAGVPKRFVDELEMKADGG